MTLAVIADIHGNSHALDAVLNDIEGLGVKDIVVNGDLVNRGPNNTAVMDCLLKRDLAITLGNHDDLMCKWVDRSTDLPENWFDSPFWLATAWSAYQLQESGHLEVLRSLPMTYTFKQATLPSVLISHGSPRHYREGYSEKTQESALKEIMLSYEAGVYIGSHIHKPMQRKVDNAQVLNTGAVGAPFNKDWRAQYLLLCSRGSQWEPVFRRVEYDHVAALKAFETSGYLEEGGLSAVIFYNELLKARSYLSPFWLWTEQQEVDKDWAAWEAYKKAFPEKFA